MKRALLFFIAILSITTVFGQAGKVAAASALIDQGDLDAAKRRLDEAMIHEKSKNLPRTYIVAARLSTEEYRRGGSTDVDKIIGAADFYLKAIGLDQKGDAKGKGIGRSANELKLTITQFMPELQNAGIEAFNAEKFPVAMNVFERVAILSNNPIFFTKGQPEVLDSVFTYYTAIAALRAENWKKAEEYFQKSIDVKYGEGDAVLLLNDVYGAMTDTVKMINNLQKGSELFPQDDRIIINLINVYLKTGQYHDALRYLNSAMSKDPDNATYYFARGFLHENNKELEEAEKDYLKAIELQSDYYEPLISLGIIYYNRGADQTQLINSDSKISNKDYEAGLEKSQEFFRQALPYVERARELKSDESVVLETLKTLYYRLQMNEKYDEVSKVIDNL